MAIRVTPVGPAIQANNESAEGIRELAYILADAGGGTLGGADMAVSQHAGTPGMSVDVAAGRALIPGTSTSFQGMYHLSNDAVVTLSIATAPGSNQRIDLVCASIQDAAYTGATNTGLLQVVTGTPASSPAVPATPASSIVLAHVFVGTSVTSILNANINGTTGTNNPDTTAFLAQRCVDFQAYAVGGSSGTITATTSPGAAVANTTVPVNCSSNRNLRITISGFLIFSTTAIAAVSVWRDAATVIGGNINMSGTASLQQPFALTVIDTAATAGVHVYQVRVWVTAGNVVANSPCTICVDDLGPV